MNTMYNTCPCDKCVCLPVCRHKTWDNLIHNCSLIHDYVNKHSSYDGVYYYKLVIERILSPTLWKLDEKGYFRQWRGATL
jgi:hypothetical protein